MNSANVHKMRREGGNNIQKLFLLSLLFQNP